MEFYFFLYHFSGKQKADRYKKIVQANFKVLPAGTNSTVATAVMRSHMLKKNGTCPTPTTWLTSWHGNTATKF